MFKNVFVFCEAQRKLGIQIQCNFIDPQKGNSFAAYPVHKLSIKPGEDRLLGQVDFGSQWSLYQLVTCVAAISLIAVN